ncbi:NAD(P)H-dependent oxidoreductase [Qaidamihabitans albus]|uniref:NAD(P)H-dependent oxidoreductase n=1 Tax=Qaidamihabitans albus TaxID=2795733 RepID=UPI0018F1383B|nr:NAD(P)H-dependent oxidoreductase [Qaidamihabitans albus]
MMRVVGVVGGPEPGGRTRTTVASVLRGVRDADTELVELSQTGLDTATDAIDAADAVVFGSPVYRATYSQLLKDLLESTGRGQWGETSAPLLGKAAATVLTGASPHHFLATNDLRNVLAGFFAAQVLSPGLYLHHGDFDDRVTLAGPSAELARQHGEALGELAAAVRLSTALRTMAPQV